MENHMNAFGVSKDTLSLKLYNMLLDGYNIEPYDLDYDGFKALFDCALEDYSLVLKSTLID